jgi:serine/threonine-protein kinase RsbW
LSVPASAGAREVSDATVPVDRGGTSASARRIEITIPSDTVHLPALRAFLRSLFATGCLADPGERVQAELQLVLQEACVNAIRHASVRPRILPIRVVFIPLPDGITIEVCDHGAGFDPAKVPEPVAGTLREGGYGVYIIGQFTDCVRVGRRGDLFVVSMTRRFGDGDRTRGAEER